LCLSLGTGFSLLDRLGTFFGTYLKETPSQNALRGVLCGVTGTYFVIYGNEGKFGNFT